MNVPANASVQDYLPYDAILQHADVFVTNGGSGSSKQISPRIPSSLVSYMLACTEGDILVRMNSRCGPGRATGVGGARIRQGGSQHACGMGWVWHQSEDAKIDSCTDPSSCRHCLDRSKVQGKSYPGPKEKRANGTNLRFTNR